MKISEELYTRLVECLGWFTTDGDRNDEEVISVLSDLQAAHEAQDEEEKETDEHPPYPEMWKVIDPPPVFIKKEEPEDNYRCPYCFGPNFDITVAPQTMSNGDIPTCYICNDCGEYFHSPLNLK